jgi:hypothetical protein
VNVLSLKSLFHSLTPFGSVLNERNHLWMLKKSVIGMSPWAAMIAAEFLLLPSAKRQLP